MKAAVNYGLRLSLEGHPLLGSRRCRQDLVASTEDEAFLLPRVLVCLCVLGGTSRVGMFLLPRVLVCLCVLGGMSRVGMPE